MPHINPEERLKYQREYQRKWRAANKAKVKEIQKRHREKIKTIIHDAKIASGGCACGETDPRCLDFHHHEDNKLFSVGETASRVRSIQAVKDEIAKCKILCANCHRKVHLA